MNSFSTVMAVVAALCGVAPVARAAPVPDRSTLESWIAAQKPVQRVVVELTQERFLKGLRKPLAATGRLWLDRRGLMRWQMGDPPKTIALYKDREVMVIKPEKKTVEKRTLGAEGDPQGEMERSFLRSGLPDSVESIEKFFRIGETTRANGLATVRLTPRDAQTGTVLLAVDLLIDEAKMQLSGYDVSFRDGSVIKTSFTALRINPPADESVFSFDTAGFQVEEWKR